MGAVDGMGAWKAWAVCTTMADRPRHLDDPTRRISSISPLLSPLTHCVCEQFLENIPGLLLYAATVFIALHALARPNCSDPCPCLVFAGLRPWTSKRVGPIPVKSWFTGLLNFFSLPGQDFTPGL
jgi:hypothetical protein